MCVSRRSGRERKSPNFLGRPVVDGTALTGKYDWELTYQSGNPEMLLNDLREKLGLELVKARRRIPVLVVERAE